MSDTTTIRVDTGLRDEAKLTAVRLGLKLKDFVELALERAIVESRVLWEEDQ